MARIPVRFERMAAAFDTATIAASRLCESSGSEHSPESQPADLSDLVNSFMEREYGTASDEEALLDNIDRDLEALVADSDKIIHDGSDNEGGHSLPDSEKKEVLRDFLSHNGDDVKRKIHDEAEIAFGVIDGGVSSSGFKRRLMTLLRQKGFDAGLCKSKWDKSKRFPAGDYEYVDVNVQGTRYIVEAIIAGEFEIARPTENYGSLIEIFPAIFVGKVSDLKQIVRVMSSAMRQSLKANEMPIPPWRRNCYMQLKWFGSYKRTTKPLPSKKLSGNNAHRALEESKSRSVGFEFNSLPELRSICRDGIATKAGFRVSNLTAALNG